VELWFDPDKWIPLEGQQINPMAEFVLIHEDGDAYAMLVAERISGGSFESLKSANFDNLRRSSDSLEVSWEEERVVNGKKFLAVKCEVVLGGFDFSYIYYFWSGQAGSLTVASFTGTNIFEEYSEDIVELLSGIVVTKD
jgi:hypothetical protein